MCCIFTCCGWMIDLIQRFWTFTMSCCISSAVCCALVTASMAGIALGYNYSLAEYIDLKETNVSVYLKRGVFDDEIADDMDWRRSGHMPVQGHLKEDNLVTGEMAGPDEMPLRSGRRLEDSLIISDDKHKFEGSLMRLTARPPDARRSEQTQEPVTSDERLAEIMNKYPMGSLEQMKAIHGLMNMRRSGGQRHTVLPTTQRTEGFEIDGRRAVFPHNSNNMRPMDYGPINSETYQKLNSARFAVPDESIRDSANWFLPKNQIPDSYKSTMDVVEYENVPASRITRPQPFRMSTEIQRPTRVTTQQRPTPTHNAMPKNFDNQETAILGSPFDKLKNKLLMEKMGLPGINKTPVLDPPSGSEFKSDDDYEEEANKGLPIRKKRNKRNVVNEKGNSLYPTLNDYHVNLNETAGNITSIQIRKPKSLSHINVDEKSLTSKLNVSSIEPTMNKESFFKFITRFVFL